MEFEGDDTGKFTKTEINKYGQRIYDLMQKLDTDNIGQEEIVKDAENPETAYHNYFEWNNKVAGHQYRLIQAGELLRRVKIKIINPQTNESRRMRAFYNVEYKGRRTYVPYKLVFATPDLAEQVIHKALFEAELWYCKYNTYKELQPISRVIKKTLKENNIALKT